MAGQLNTHVARSVIHTDLIRAKRELKSLREELGSCGVMTAMVWVDAVDQSIDHAIDVLEELQSRPHNEQDVSQDGVS